MHYTQQNTDIPLLYYKKADNFKDWFCKNGEVKDDFKLHQSDHKITRNILVYITEDLSKESNIWYNLMTMYHKGSTKIVNYRQQVMDRLEGERDS